MTHSKAPLPVSRWFYVITGFLQHQGTRTGLIDLWHELEDDYCAPGIKVRLCPWNHAWDAEAEFVFRLSADHASVGVGAYSWGAGYGMREFALGLQRRGLAVDQAVLLDPVYRHPYWLGQWRTFFPWYPISIPDNVRQVRAFKQTTNWPRGHALMADRPLKEPSRMVPGTYVHPVKTLEWATHQTMDDHRECLAEVRRVAECILRGTAA